MSRILRLRNPTPRPANYFRPAEQPDKVETAARILSGLLLLGTLVSGGALFFQAAPAHAERQVAQAPAEPPAKPGKHIKLNTGAAATSRRVWVDPPALPAGMKQDQAITAAVEPARVAVSSTAPTPSPATAAVPTDCLPEGLRSVLKEVETRFGTVTLVSTTELHTDNHSRGSVRHKLHGACEAVDFKVTGSRQAVLAYLRTRREVAGINSYGNNGVIHIDHSEPRQVAQR